MIVDKCKSKLLSTKNVSKNFGGVLAVDNVSIEVHENKITGLIGPNGAGKTTLFNLITGLTKPSSGEFFLLGKKYSPFKIHKVVEKGIARTFQNIRLFNNMSVLENVMVGRHVKTNFFSMGIFSSLFRITTYNNCENKQKEVCIRILEKVGLLEKKDLISSNLSYGDQRRLEIARALACEPKILALDEPAAGMNPTEKIKLKKLIKELLLEKVTILIIEHDVKLMSDLCDHIYVMDRGKIISSGKPTDIKNDKKVIKAYLGGTSK